MQRGASILTTQSSEVILPLGVLPEGKDKSGWTYWHIWFPSGSSWLGNRSSRGGTDPSVWLKILRVLRISENNNKGKKKKKVRVNRELSGFVCYLLYIQENVCSGFGLLAHLSSAASGCLLFWEALGGASCRWWRFFFAFWVFWGRSRKWFLTPSFCFDWLPTPFSGFIGRDSYC